MLIGERLRKLREERNFSYRDIVVGTGMSHMHIYNVENGVNIPRLDTLERFAVFYGMTLSELLKGVGGHVNRKGLYDREPQVPALAL